MSRTRPLVIVLACLLLALGVPPAQAVAPGDNGEIVVLAQDPADARFQTVIAVDPATGDRRELVPPNTIDSVAVSPDGTMVAYTLQRNLYLQPLGGTTEDRELLVQLDASTYALEWSPDGSEILVVDGESFTIYPVGGGTPRVLAPNQQTQPGLPYRSVTWTAQNQIVALELSALRVIDAATGEAHLVDPPESPNGQDTLGIDASPDGSQVVFPCLQSTDVSFRLQLCITGLDMVVQRTVDLSDVEPAHPAFSPDGTQVAFIAPARADDAMLYVSPIVGPGTQALGPVGGLGVDPEWAVAGGGTPPPPPASEEPLECGGFDSDAVTTERADFVDPVAYAVAVSQARFDCDGSDGAGYVVLSRADAFADSLVGAALTGDGPLLFTETDSLPDATAEEIQRLLEDGDPIYLLGGVAAISQGVEDLLTAFEVRRLAGPSRVETSVRVAEEVLALGGDSSTVAVARAGGPADNPTAAWADSVSAGAWTAAEAVPTVVTDSASVHPAVAAFLDSLDGLGRTVLLGGEAALSAAVAAAVPSPVRVAGDSRDATAEAIASELVGDPAEDGERRLVVVNGYRADGWLFGLPAAGLAADAGAALALAQDPVPPATLRMACSPDDVDLLLAGSLEILPETVAQQLDQASSC